MTVPIDPLDGGVLCSPPGPSGSTDLDDLRELVDDIVHHTASRSGSQCRVEQEFDEALWERLDAAGVTRLTTELGSGGGPVEMSVVLRALARNCSAVPLAETDLLGAWLAGLAGIECPQSAPVTVALGDPARCETHAGTVTAALRAVPWPGPATILLALPVGRHLLVARASDVGVTVQHNLAGEPRGRLAVDLPTAECAELDVAVATQLQRRGAWARCVQTVGALDAAAEASVAYTGGRIQFGRPLNRFQTVQHALALMTGEIERARSVVSLAVAAAADHGFDSPQADYAVTLAKVTLGQVVPVVSRTAHQLHGALGVTLEHDLWRATMRARSWVGEFGTPGDYAAHLGDIALRSHRDGDPAWDALFGTSTLAWA